ncbi:hypothetical protein EYF80_016276 [Liparis tanakae]|uniref:Uncharacterized protein n=1 Tax=Liparis tanakae TaxID=230148 RepID=A0A4Z2I620_9TELE|nr:hypothetical protein EYF80_016276 [Liparis tanakae]
MTHSVTTAAGSQQTARSATCRSTLAGIHHEGEVDADDNEQEAQGKVEERGGSRHVGNTNRSVVQKHR